MKWLKNKIRKWALNDEPAKEYAVVCDSSVRRRSFDSVPLKISVFRASGGLIVETSFYDVRKDNHNEQLHIITPDEDIGQRLGQIITMESLRNS